MTSYDALAIVNGFPRELNDRARLDVAVRADVMAHAGRHRAERFALVVPVRIDDRDRQTGPHLHDESPHCQHLLGRQRQLGIRLGTDRAIGVEPDIVNAHVDQTAQPALGHQIVDIGLADAGGDTGDQPVPAAGFESRQRLVQNVETSAPLVADDLGAFDADQRRDVAERPQPPPPRR